MLYTNCHYSKPVQVKKLLLYKPFLFTVILIVSASLHVSAGPYAQGISITLQSVGLKKAMIEIEKKTEYRFLYNDAIIPSEKKVTIEANNMPVSDFFQKLFSGTGLSYRILDNNLVVLKDNQSEIPQVTDHKVTGKIIDDKGMPVANASIVVKGTKLGTVSDASGNFSITVPDDAVLIITAIGYDNKEVSVSGVNTINVSLSSSNKQLNEVVVIGYGSQKRKSVTGAISRVSGDAISKQPLLTAAQGLQGLAPGIRVVGTSEPGAQPRVTIRGLNTILTNENPLYVVDGVLTSDITNINTADIQSVDVLKDGAAAIYGSRAANGVILITTKKGKSGKANVSLNTYTGFRKLTNVVQMADRNLYLDYTNEARKYDDPTVDPISTLDNTANTDWFNEITGNGALSNVALSVNGGNDNITYLFSAGYLKDKGVLQGADYDRITLRLNNEYKLTSAIKLGHVLTTEVTNSNNKSAGTFSDAYRASPAAPLKDATGNYGYQPGLTAAGNPVANLELTNNFTKLLRLQGNFYGDVTIVKGLSFHTSWGFDNTRNDNTNYNPVYSYGTFSKTTSELFVTNAKRFYWVWDNILNYKFRITDDHSIELTVGHTAERDKSTSIGLRAADVPPQRNLWYINQGDGSVTYVASSTGAGNLQRVSDFGRLNYSYKDRYNLSGVLRRDGSSTFPESQQYGTFYSVAGSWVISSESFMSDVKGIDYLKLRAGYASLGNDGISQLVNNELATLLSVTQTNPYSFNNTLAEGITFDQLKDAQASWETTKSFDIGLEFGLLNKKLNGEVSYYNKLTNAYIRVPTPPFVDPNGILSRAADVRNKGVEISLNWVDKPSRDFSYNIGTNLTFNNNNVENVEGGIDLKEGGLGNGEVTTSTVVDQPIGSFWLYQTDGIFQSQSDIDKSPHFTGTQPGDFKYVDVNGDGLLDERDRVFVGSYQPKFYYGINGGINWKQFDFSIDVYGNAGNKVYNGKKSVRFGNENIEASRADRWTPDNPSNTDPRASNAIPKPSTYYLESGSFVRINNITLGYSLPQDFLSKAYMSSARFFIAAQNPLTIKKFSGFSPELPGSNALNSGIELFVYPIVATYMIGVNINFK